MGVLLEALGILMGFDFAPFNRPVTLPPVRCTPWDPSLGESLQQRLGRGINKKAGQCNLVESFCVSGPANRNVC